MGRERKAAPGPEPDASAPSFEEAIERLQAIVEELEGGSLSLEESIARYEEGVRLSRRLTQTLDEAEKRIERLSEDPPGTPVTEPMDLEGAGEDRPPAAAAPPPAAAPPAAASPAPAAPAPAKVPAPGRSMGELPF
jgi:exodeoxyribonuclease VII small subunit